MYETSNASLCFAIMIAYECRTAAFKATEIVCSLACQTFEGGRERLVTIARNPWTVGMFGMFIITISTCKINSSRMRHTAMECLTYCTKLKDCRQLHSNSTKYLVPLLQELVCHPSAGLVLVLHYNAFLCCSC